MRLAHVLVVPALLASAACASAPHPVTTAEPAIATADAPGLRLWVPGGGSAAGSAISASTDFTIDRDAYAAAFLVTRDGRLRVVWPESPGSSGRVRKGETIRTDGSAAQYAALGYGARTTTPYTFVIVSDERLNLSRFGTGKRWGRQGDLRGIAYPEDVIETIAEGILPAPDAHYAADYAYVGPRLLGPALSLAMRCARTNSDVRDVGYYRDLWAVFDPYDNTLGLTSFTAAWAYLPAAFFPFSGRGLGLGLYFDRASRATNAFHGGCATPIYPFSLASVSGVGTRTLLTSAQPFQPSPAQPAGDSVRVPRRLPGPDAVYGAPGTSATAAAATRAAPGTAESRMARLRDRMEVMAEGRRGGERAGERAGARTGAVEWRSEPLTRIDGGRIEGTLRRLERREALVTAIERAGGSAAMADRLDRGFGGTGVGPRGTAERSPSGRAFDGSRPISRTDGSSLGGASGSAAGSAAGTVVTAPRVPVTSEGAQAVRETKAERSQAQTPP